MKYHTIKSERFSTRCNGQYASYPIYTHNGDKIGAIECYASDLTHFLKRADEKGNFDGLPFHIYEWLVSEAQVLEHAPSQIKMFQEYNAINA